MKKYIKKYMVFIVAIILLLCTFAAVNAQDIKESDISTQLELGDKYLSELNYEEALVAYNKVLKVEPKNVDAKMGIVDVLIKTDKQDEAIQFLTEELDKYDDKELYTKLADIYENNEEYEKAISILNLIVEKTDSEDLKIKQKEILNKFMALGNEISLGNSYISLVKDSKVYARGSNKFGQVGAENENHDKFTNLNFPTIPKKVFCGDNTTYVVDDQNKLWSTGLNLTGQAGLDYLSLPFEKEFKRVDGVDDVLIASSGSNHTLLVKSDNTLWGAGNNSSMQLGFGDAVSIDSFAQIETFSDVMNVDCISDYSIILKLDGTLWGMGALPFDIKLPSNNTGIIANNIIQAESNINYVATLDQKGDMYIYGNTYMFPTESDYYGSNSKIQFDKKIKNFSTCDYGAIVIDEENEIYLVSDRINDNFKNIKLEAKIISIDGRGSKIGLKIENGKSYIIEFNSNNSLGYEIIEL